MVTKLSSTSSWEALGVDLHESIRRELAVRAILFEPLVPFIDGALVVPRVWSQELEVFLTKPISSGRLVPHLDALIRLTAVNAAQTDFLGTANTHRDDPLKTHNLELHWDLLPDFSCFGELKMILESRTKTTFTCYSSISDLWTRTPGFLRPISVSFLSTSGISQSSWLD